MEASDIDIWCGKNKKQLTEDIIALVNIKSVAEPYSPQNAYGKGSTEALAQMLNLAQKYGFQTENFDNRCGEISFGSGEKSVGIWSHLDVVPEGNDWIFSPYNCTVKNDFLIGRGVQDNKGPAVAVLYAIRYLKEHNIKLNYTLKQILGCDEENGMSDVPFYLSRAKAPNFSMVADCAFPVCYGEKGILRLVLQSPKVDASIVNISAGDVVNTVPDFARIELNSTVDKKEVDGLLYESNGETSVISACGRSAHAAFSQSGINALGKLCSKIKDLKVFSEETKSAIGFIGEICNSYNGSVLGIECSDSESGSLTCVGSVVKIEKGRLLLSADIRYPITADYDIIESSIKRSAANRGFNVMEMHNSSPNHFPKDSPYVTMLTEISNSIMGENLSPYTMGGGTYARKIPNAVAFGPGMNADISTLNLPEGHGGCHSPDEAQSVNNLITAIKIYVNAFIGINKILKEDNQKGKLK